MEVPQQEKIESEGEGEAVSPPQLSLRKKLLFSVSFTAIGLALVELTFFLLLGLPGYDRKGIREYRNKFNNETRGSLFITTETAEELEVLLDNTIGFNLIGNELTYPDPDLIFRVRSSAGSQVEFAGLKINSLGFRGEEFDLEKEDARRVMVLGDSCAFGWWLQDIRQTWAHQLELILDQQFGDTQIFNFGQPGYSTQQCSILFDRWFSRVRPDYLILYAGWNDLHGSMVTDEQSVKLLRGTMSPATRWLRKSYTYDFIEQSVMKYRIANLKRKGEMHKTWRRVPLEKSVQNMRRIISKAREAGCEVIVVLPPFSSERAPDKPNGFANMLELRDRISDAVRDETFVAIFKEMEYDHPDSQRYFVEGDGYHPNRDGALVLARGLAQAIMHLDGMRASGPVKE